ncbi:transcription factor 7-like 2 [Synchiropus picturatus]
MEPQESEVELDLVLSTLREMFGDLSPASATPVALDCQPPESSTFEPLVDRLSGAASCGLRQEELHGGVPSGVHMEPCYGSISSRLTLDQPHSGVLMEPVHGCVPSVPVRQIHPVYSFPTGHLWSMHHGGVFVYNQNNYMPMMEVLHDAPPGAPCVVNADMMINAKAPSYSGMSHPRHQPSDQQKSGPYIRRPPNAFMIFMRENRAKITASLKPKHSVEANSILGKMWKSMSAAEQEKYYQLAAVERRLHAAQHPDWSSKDNYGKKMKRYRGKAARP